MKAITSFEICLSSPNMKVIEFLSASANIALLSCHSKAMSKFVYLRPEMKHLSFDLRPVSKHAAGKKRSLKRQRRQRPIACGTVEFHLCQRKLRNVLIGVHAFDFNNTTHIIPLLLLHAPVNKRYNS